jgi:hypothetical protein
MCYDSGMPFTIMWFIRSLADAKGDMLVSMTKPDQSYELRNFEVWVSPYLKFLNAALLTPEPLTRTVGSTVHGERLHAKASASSGPCR